MAPGLMQFKIVLDRPDYEFSPGEIVTGKVIVELGRPKSIKGLKVRAMGTADVRWSETTGSGKDETSTTYSNSETYFRTEFYLIGGSGDGDNIEFQPGHQEYPFNFCLPQNIPSSFQSTDGWVRYAIKATIERPWKFDHNTTMLFTVVTPFDLSQCPAAQVPIDDENFKSFCCFPCITMGKMQTHFYMHTSGFAVGEVLNAKIGINNYSTSVDVTDVKLMLQQEIMLEATMKRRKNTHVVQTAKNSGPFPKKAEIMMSMQVPAPFSNLQFCKIIDVQYRVIAKISVSGCHCASKNSYPIVIGTKPTVGSRPTNSPVVPEMINHLSSFGVPTAPFLSERSPTPPGAIPFPMPMIDQRFNNPISVGANPTGDIYPPPIPRISNPGFQYPPSAGGPPIGFIDPGPMGSTTGFTEKPPPSYDDCLKMAKNN